MKEDLYSDSIIENLSTKELIEIRNQLEFKRGQIIEEWGEEIGKYTENPDFDQYSRHGERVLAKITKKYSNESGELVFILEEIGRELAKRENYDYEQRFIEGGNYEKFNETDDEFLEKEENKTLLHKYDLDLDEEEDDEEDEEYFENEDRQDNDEVDDDKN